MEPHTVGLEQRLADLEVEIDRVSVALHRWRETQDHLPSMERRFAQLTDQCADILKQWTVTGERHAQAVGELEARLTGWNDVETRLQRDASSRYHALEHAIENEWASLRHLHEEPARQLRTYAESLTEISVATAGSAQSGLERAEARLATIERDLHRRMDELSRDVQSAVSQLRHQDDGAAPRGQASPWALDEVTRLHQELRESDNTRGAITAGFEPAALVSSTASSALRPASSFFEASNGSLGNHPAGESATTESPLPHAPLPGFGSDWKWYVAVAALAVGFGVAVVFALLLYRQAGAAAARASEAQQQAANLATVADQRIEAARQDAAAQIELARDAASKAQVTSDILVAPDLVRFNLVGGDAAARFSAQLLWSRSRGMVFSGSRLPAVPPGATYQMWLLTAGPPVSAGAFVPDASGRAISTTSTPPSVPRPITGVLVTLEQQPGGQSPSDAIVLARAQ